MAAEAAGPVLTGVSALRDPVLNKSGTRFTEAEKDALKVRGLVPGGNRATLSKQVELVMATVERLESDLSRYEFLQRLQDTDMNLFYAALLEHTAALMPLVYTPTVGAGCINYSKLLIPRRGMYITLADRGNVAKLLRNWHSKTVTAIVVTDGERILGLGDLGANGMGIPVGKLALYSALAGVNPATTLPITLDVGTNNETLLADPHYVGVRAKRESGDAYYALVDEFVHAVKEVFPMAMVQWEDFGNKTAFDILRKYQDTIVSFNDDIQGTASVVLAGLLSAPRLPNVKPLAEQTYLFYGAGEAGVGISELIAYAVAKETGCTLTSARSRIWLVDSKGLVTAARTAGGAHLEHHKLDYAHAAPAGVPTGPAALLDIVRALKPTALIGVSAQPQTFTKEIVEAMCEWNKAPIIFALSNPTSKAECTAAQAYAWSAGRAVFASGSPFSSVTISISPEGEVDVLAACCASPTAAQLPSSAMTEATSAGGAGATAATASPAGGSARGEIKTFVPGQANNSWIFPAVGLAVEAAHLTRVTDHTMYVAAKALATTVSEKDLATGCLFPPLEQIRTVSAHIAAAVVEDAYSSGEAALTPKPADILAHVKSCMWTPSS